MKRDLISRIKQVAKVVKKTCKEARRVIYESYFRKMEFACTSLQMIRSEYTISRSQLLVQLREALFVTKIWIQPESLAMNFHGRWNTRLCIDILKACNDNDNSRQLTSTDSYLIICADFNDFLGLVINLLQAVCKLRVFLYILLSRSMKITYTSSDEIHPTVKIHLRTNAKKYIQSNQIVWL